MENDAKLHLEKSSVMLVIVLAGSILSMFIGLAIIYGKLQNSFLILLIAICVVGGVAFLHLGKKSH